MRDEAQCRYVQSQIAQLRQRLLDLSLNNKLLNFKFSERSRNHVRVIDELPDVVYDKLLDGKKLRFKSLGHPRKGGEPKDEQTDLFRRQLTIARNTDSVFISQVKRLEGRHEDDEGRGAVLESELRERVRLQLGLGPKPEATSITPAEQAKQLGINPSYDLPGPAPKGEAQARHTNSNLQTRLFADAQERKLSGINDGARSAFQEMGVNTLYAAFGYLEWYESESSQRTLFAPLLLHPVEMVRKASKHAYAYTVSTTGDDTEINITLKERLGKDFGIVLPELKEEEYPEAYFKRVERVIEGQPKWRLRRFLTVGLFSFSRIAMYHDLDDSRWGFEPLSDMPLLHQLLGGGEATKDIQDPVDANGSLEDLRLIADADASQLAAIREAASGESMALIGPPGTGKSQTITNMIALAMKRGKSVLFLAEKLAALEVVKKRLDDAGLGPYILELHSAKARKKEVLQSLDWRIKTRKQTSPENYTEAWEELVKVRGGLNEYAATLNQVIGESGTTVHDAIWAATRASGSISNSAVTDRIRSARNPGAIYTTKLKLEEVLERARTLSELTQQISNEFGGLSQHPWRGVHKTSLTPFDLDEMLRDFAGWSKRLEETVGSIRSLTEETGARELVNAGRLSSALKLLAFWEKVRGKVSPSILQDMQKKEVRQSVKAFIGSRTSYANEMQRVYSYLEGGEPQSPDPKILEQTITELDSIAQVLMLDKPRTLDGIEEWVRGIQDSAQRLEEMRDSLQATIGALGLDLPPSIDAAQALILAHEILSDEDPRTLAARTTQVCDSRNSEKVDRAFKVWRELREEEEHLNTSFDLALVSSPADIDSAANALDGASVLQRLLLKKCREVKRLWGDIARGRKRPGSEEVVLELRRIAKYFHDRKAFESDTDVRSLLAAGDEPGDVDFEALSNAAQFASRLRTKLSGSQAEFVAVRELLLEGDTSTLSQLTSERLSASIDSFATKLEDISKLPASKVERNASLLLKAYSDAGLKGLKVQAFFAASSINRSLATRSLSSLLGAMRKAHDDELSISNNTNISELLGDKFRGVDTDINPLCQVLDFLSEYPVNSSDDELVASVVTAIENTPSESLRSWVSNTDGLLKDVLATRQEISLRWELDLQEFLGCNPDDTDLVEESRILRRALNHSDSFSSWDKHKQTKDSLTRVGYGEFLQIHSSELPHDYQLLEDCIRYFHFSGLMRTIYEEHPKLREFDGVKQHELRRRFQELEHQFLELEQSSVSSKLSTAPKEYGTCQGPKKNWTELHLVRNEIGKKKRHIPIRNLLSRSGASIQGIKPCWMMSPASVAQFLEPDDMRFDLLIIDEASQMKPEDAIGALARCRQAVIVGDPMQLPPTTFFERMELVDDDDAYAEDIVDNESILDLALTRFGCSRELLWHYRSQHESLIAFSNQQFYDSKLVVFPSPTQDSSARGVSLEQVEGAYVPKASFNLPEAERMVELAEEVIAQSPESSLGLVVMNQSQREQVSDLLDLAFLKNDKAQEYRERWADTLEPVFVKNLENVQGDERDVMIVGTVYGAAADTGVVAQRFGPVNTEVGHRRLNVLLTRAKKRLLLVSSLKPIDILGSPTSRRGVHVLRQYLEYAQNHRMSASGDELGVADSDFEVFVADALRARGVDVAYQVGVDGYRIDLAVRHPMNPNVYVLGIECDGAQYHSGKLARDRDRLREEVLRRLGWKIYRIWSTDWFENPQRETEKLLAEVERCIAGGQSEHSTM